VFRRGWDGVKQQDRTKEEVLPVRVWVEVFVAPLHVLVRAAVKVDAAAEAVHFPRNHRAEQHHELLFVHGAILVCCFYVK